MSETAKIVFSIIGSVAGTIFTVHYTTFRQKVKDKENTRLQLRYELIALCQNILSKAYFSTTRELEAYYKYSMHKANPDEDFDKVAYTRYVAEAEKGASEMHENYVTLISKIGLMQSIWDSPWEVSEIKRLIGKTRTSHYILMKVNVFSEGQTSHEIKRLYQIQQNHILKYITEFSWGKNLMEIQKLLDKDLAEELTPEPLRDPNV